MVFFCMYTIFSITVLFQICLTGVSLSRFLYLSMSFFHFSRPIFIAGKIFGIRKCFVFLISNCCHPEVKRRFIKKRDTHFSLWYAKDSYCAEMHSCEEASTDTESSVIVAVFMLNKQEAIKGAEMNLPDSGWQFLDPYKLDKGFHLSYLLSKETEWLWLMSNGCDIYKTIRVMDKRGSGDQRHIFLFCNARKN